MFRTTNQMSATSFHTSDSLIRTNRSILLITITGSSFFALFGRLGVSEGAALFLSALGTLAALQLLLHNGDSSPASALRKVRDVSVMTSLGLAVLLFSISNSVAHFLSVFAPELSTILEVAAFTAASPLDMTFLILGSTLLVPFYEELVFRGMALKSYSGLRSPMFAALSTSLLFAVAHGSLVQALAIFPFGFLMALAMLKTNQLWTVILAHGLSNLVGVSLMQFDDLMLLPETSAYGIAALILAVFLFWLSVRWLSLPPKSQPIGRVEMKSVWTPSLVVVVIIMAFTIVLTTLAAYFPSLGVS